MTATQTFAFPKTNLVGWERTLYAFLVEKERRSGSYRTVEGYSRMLQDFFERVRKSPDEVTAQEVFVWAHGKGVSGKHPSPVTIGASMACLSSFYRFLLQMGGQFARGPRARQPREQSRFLERNGVDVRARAGAEASFLAVQVIIVAWAGHAQDKCAQASMSSTARIAWLVGSSPPASVARKAVAVAKVAAVSAARAASNPAIPSG